MLELLTRNTPLTNKKFAAAGARRRQSGEPQPCRAMEFTLIAASGVRRDWRFTHRTRTGKISLRFIVGGARKYVRLFFHEHTHRKPGHARISDRGRTVDKKSARRQEFSGNESGEPGREARSHWQIQYCLSHSPDGSVHQPGSRAGQGPS